MLKKLFPIFYLVTIFTPLVLVVLNLEIGADSESSQSPNTKSKLIFHKTKNANNFPSAILSIYRDIINYKDDYDKSYTENFKLKSFLFIPFYQIKWNIFKTNPIPHKVVKGNDGWYFLGDSYSNVILESKAILNFTEEELSVIRTSLVQQQDWLRKKQIAYYVAIAPNKHSIYDKELSIRKSDKKTKLKQLNNLGIDNGVNVIDMSEYLLHPKERLFHKTNTHWNDIGAYLGYQKLISDLQKDYPLAHSVPLDSFTRTTAITWEEDLTKMLHVKEQEERIELEMRNPAATRMQRMLKVPENYNRDTLTYEIRYTSKANNLKVIVFRDSFCEALVKFISESFGESLFIWSSEFDRGLIASENPDIVVRQIVERNIDALLVGN